MHSYIMHRILCIQNTNLPHVCSGYLKRENKEKYCILDKGKYCIIDTIDCKIDNRVLILWLKPNIHHKSNLNLISVYTV